MDEYFAQVTGQIDKRIEILRLHQNTALPLRKQSLLPAHEHVH
jgi:hypothetical protein